MLDEYKCGRGVEGNGLMEHDIMNEKIEERMYALMKREDGAVDASMYANAIEYMQNCFVKNGSLQ